MSCVIAIQTGCNNVPAIVGAAFGFGDQMFRGATKATHLPEGKFVLLLERPRAGVPDGKSAVEASGLLVKEGLIPKPLDCVHGYLFAVGCEIPTAPIGEHSGTQQPGANRARHRL